MLKYAALLLCLSSRTVVRLAQAQTIRSISDGPLAIETAIETTISDVPTTFSTGVLSTTTAAADSIASTSVASETRRVTTSNSDSFRSTLPTITPIAAISQVTSATSVPGLPRKVSDQTVAIILAASLGGTALIVLLAVLWCAFRHKSVDYQSYTRTPSPLGSDRASKVMQAVTSRRLFSSRSSHAPEVLHRSDSSSSRGLRRGIATHQTYRPNSGEIGLALTKVEEGEYLALIADSQHPYYEGSPRASEPDMRPKSSLTSHGKSSEGHSARPSMSRYQNRSMDLLDAAARYSSDGSRPHRPSLSPSTHRNSSHSVGTPLTPPRLPFSQISPQTSASSIKLAANPVYRHSRESLHSNEKAPVAPLIPARNPKRRSSPAVHDPVWFKMGNDDFDESDGQRGTRERPSMAMARRSSSWKRDTPDGRYEMA